MSADLFNSGSPSYEAARFKPPRPFQVTAHEKLREGARNGHRRQLLVAPTGAGKTYLGLRIAHEALQKGRKALFVCDRIALINQTSARADEYGLSAHGVIQADHWRYQPEMPLQIASVQTLRSRTWPVSDVVIIDEAHTQYPTWKEYIQQTSAAVVGLTATPCSRGLGLLFTNMVNAASMHELTEQKILVPMRILSCTKPDMTGAEISGGEWTDKAASEREAEIIGDVVTEWAKYGDGRKTIAFGADIAYCEMLVQRFNAAGIYAQTFTARTSERQRELLLKEFSKPDSKIRVLVSVEALAKGFDVQDIGVVIDARPLRKSLSTAIQMWGRGLRSSPDTGKTECILLDHSGNIQRFYRDFESIYYNGFTSLDMSEKLDATARKEEEDYTPTGCPECGHKPFLNRCMACGFQKPTRVLEDTSAGEMREIKLGKKVLASDRYELWQQLTGYVLGSASKKKQGYAAALFHEITGSWPSRDWHVDFTDPAPISRATLNEVKRQQIAYRNRRSSASA